MSSNKVPEAQWPREFRHTLTKWAREWYEEIDVPPTWPEMSKKFTDHYSKQGRSDQQLHERWRTLKFNPETDDIATFISNVRQTAGKLEYTDKAIMNCIKANMPKHLRGSMYKENNLKELIKMVKDLFAPEADAPNACTLKSMTTSEGNKVEDPSGHSTLIKALKGVLNKMPNDDTLIHTLRDLLSEVTDEDSPSHTHRSRPRSRRESYPRSFDKSPNRKRPRSSSRPVNKDKGRCFQCQEFGHFQEDCPQNTEDRDESPDQSPTRSRSRGNRPSMYAMRDIGPLYRYQVNENTGKAYMVPVEDPSYLN
jgi:uncharacterized damage-inducible protein DinB